MRVRPYRIVGIIILVDDMVRGGYRVRFDARCGPSAGTCICFASSFGWAFIYTFVYVFVCIFACHSITLAL